MKQKKWYMRVMSAFMTVMMLLPTIITPTLAFAAEATPIDNLAKYVDALPLMEEVEDQLDPSELVSADSYSVELGAEVDLNTDFTNIDYDNERVKVTFYKAENAEGQPFSTDCADIYQTMYYAEPYSGNSAYKFTRMITVSDLEIEAEERTENTELEEDTLVGDNEIENEYSDTEHSLESSTAAVMRPSIRPMAR